MDGCVFCKIANGSSPSHKIFEDKNTIAFLDIFPCAIGHTLVITKKHYKNMEDVPPQELAEAIKTVQLVGKACMKALGAPGFNVHQSNNKPAGQVVFHLHFHVVPRFENDGVSFKWQVSEKAKEQIPLVKEKMMKVLWKIFNKNQ
ncbi:MAG: HIT family protein [archaeon]|nr:HIT family protein [archaeon]